MGQSTATTFTPSQLKPIFPSRTDMFTGPGMDSLGNLARDWFLFFQQLAAESAIAKYSTSWTSQTTVVVTHNLQTLDVGWFVYNSSGVAQTPASVTVNDENTLTLTFGSAFTGRVVVFG